MTHTLLLAYLLFYVGVHLASLINDLVKRNTGGAVLCAILTALPAALLIAGV